MPTDRMGPPPGASPPMRMLHHGQDQTTLPYTSLWREDAPQWRAPLGSSTDRQAPQTPKLCKKPPSQFIVAPRAQASRRCETQATLGGKPPSCATVSVP